MTILNSLSQPFCPGRSIDLVDCTLQGDGSPIAWNSLIPLFVEKNGVAWLPDWRDPPADLKDPHAVWIHHTLYGKRHSPPSPEMGTEFHSEDFSDSLSRVVCVDIHSGVLEEGLEIICYISNRSLTLVSDVQPKSKLHECSLLVEPKFSPNYFGETFIFISCSWWSYDKNVCRSQEILLRNLQHKIWHHEPSFMAEVVTLDFLFKSKILKRNHNQDEINIHQAL